VVGGSRDEDGRHERRDAQVRDHVVSPRLAGRGARAATGWHDAGRSCPPRGSPGRGWLPIVDFDGRPAILPSQNTDGSPSTPG
jgi:hypothetical protein